MASLPDPAISYVGPVSVWWIPKPRGPRTSLRHAGIGWVLALPLTVATMLWIRDGQGGPLWPFGQAITTPAQILLRYELILLVYLSYVTLRSLPGWLRYGRLARQDARAIDASIQQERWERAALLMHRFCLLVSAVWRRVPARVSAWDSVLRNRLTRHRRVYVYYGKVAPPLPPDPSASFVPAIIPPPRPSAWSLVALVPIAILLYALFLDVGRRGQWELMLTFNVVLLMVVLLMYGGYFAMAALGRSHYFRMAPGVVQLVKFRVARRRPSIETHELRGMDIVLDLSSSWPALSLLMPGGTRRTFRLPQGTEPVEAVLRAALSSAPRPPLSEDDLVE